jgi:transposase InsO family protein
MLSRTCSSCAACQLTSGQITAQSSSLRLSETGSKRSEQRPRISSLGSPWENGYCESFNGRMRDELLNGEIFYSLARSTNHHRKNGGNTTTPSDHTVHWATAHRRPKPSSRWTPGRSCTNIQTGPLVGRSSEIPTL